MYSFVFILASLPTHAEDSVTGSTSSEHGVSLSPKTTDCMSTPSTRCPENACSESQGY